MSISPQPTLSIYLTEAIFSRIQYYPFRIMFSCRENKEHYESCSFLISQLYLLSLTSMLLKFLFTDQLFFIPLKILSQKNGVSLSYTSGMTLGTSYNDRQNRHYPSYLWAVVHRLSTSLAQIIKEFWAPYDFFLHISVTVPQRRFFSSPGFGRESQFLWHLDSPLVISSCIWLMDSSGCCCCFLAGSTSLHGLFYSIDRM